MVEGEEPMEVVVRTMPRKYIKDTQYYGIMDFMNS